ncbi:High-affinity branched-chain amino acid transport ATP-binding protein BraF [Nymphon striatum]|nr:High-affinity branched-chain amino acid transport ATP-binding protein BraF [Nymphon striatum]
MNSNTDFTLAIEDLTVSFDGFKAVDGLNFYLDQNELHVVIGPNGAGKTTVLDLICGKTKSTSGSIKFLNEELTKMSEHEIVRAGVGRKFQTPSIYENLSVRNECKEREQTAELLNKICKGRSVLVIEHDMEFVERIAHKVTVLHQGKILAVGNMQEVQNDPKVIEVYLGH